MPWNRAAVPCALGLLVMTAGTSAFAAPTDPAAAREQLKIGFELSRDNKCPEAIPHFQESLRLDPKAITLINLANCEELVGKLNDAMGHWVDARSRAQSEGAKPIEDEAAKRLAALEPRLARIRIVLAPNVPKDATVEKDGVVLGATTLDSPVPVDPGKHAIVLKIKGRPDTTTEITVAEGESKRVEIAPSEPVAPPPVTPPPTTTPETPTTHVDSSSISPLVWVGGGIALVGIGVGAVTGVMAVNAQTDADRDCPAGQCKDAQARDAAQSGQTMGTISTVGFIVGAAGAGLLVYGLTAGGSKKSADPATATATARHAPHPSSGPSASLSLLPGGFSIRGRF